MHVLTERRRTLLDDARQIKRGKSPNLRVRPEAASLRELAIKMVNDIDLLALLVKGFV